MVIIPVLQDDHDTRIHLVSLWLCLFRIYLTQTKDKEAGFGEAEVASSNRDWYGCSGACLSFFFLMHANVFLQGLCCAEGFYLFISLRRFTDLSGFLINVLPSPGFINAS